MRVFGIARRHLHTSTGVKLQAVVFTRARTVTDGTMHMQVFLDLQEIEKQDLLEFYDNKIVSSGSDTRVLAVTCTSRKHARALEAGFEGQWVIVDPIAAKNRLPVAPWSVSNAIHNMAVGAGMPASRVMCSACTCCE